MRARTPRLREVVNAAECIPVHQGARLM